MGFKAADYSVCVITNRQNNRLFGMTCAWMMQVDYDKIVCLLGSQSVTGSSIRIGDTVGVSVLNENQKEIALHFGDHHSDEVDKFKNMPLEDNGAILIAGAARQMVCEVMDILHLKEIEEDSLIYLKIRSAKENTDAFLHYGDF